MHIAKAASELEQRAAAALKAALAEVSAIHLKDFELKTTAHPSVYDITAHIDVYCHSHTLTCRVLASDEQEQVCSALQELQSIAARMQEKTLPVLIAPSLSDHAQALCRLHNAGFLDLNGNARLELDDVFLATRSHSHRSVRRAPAPEKTAASQRRGNRPELQKFPPVPDSSQTRNALWRVH